jgi:DNA-binding HxlR family transcriptional regulator
MRDDDGKPDAVPELRELVSHPHVVEVLDALSHGPMTLAGLRSTVPARRRGLATALRLLAARGLVTRSDAGTWDVYAPHHAVYRHTDLGRMVFASLSSFSFWTTIFDRALRGHSWKR